MFKFFLLLSLSFSCISLVACSNSTVEINELSERKEGKISIFEVNGKPFSGVARHEFQCNDAQKKILPTASCKDGLLQIEAHLKDGKLLSFKTWYRNGQKNSEASFLNGLKHGLVISWHEDGTKEAETRYTEGVKHGIETWWWVNGNKSYEWDRHADGRTKVSTQWHENGEKKLESQYDDGKKTSSKEWDEIGKLKVSTQWHENGEKKLESQYEDGKKVSSKEWDENGNLKP